MEPNTPTPPLTPLDTQIDLSEYEKLSTEWFQTANEVNPDTEKKIEYLLLRVLFITKIISWLTFLVLFLFIGYSWSRNQTQNSWIMRQSKFVHQWTALCNWVNAGNNHEIPASTEFLKFLAENKNPQVKVDLSKLLTDKACLTPDTMSHLLAMEEAYLTKQLKETYETVLIKKFEGSTLESSTEINTILSFDPSTRMNYHEIIKLINEKVKAKNKKWKSAITCSDVRFQGLSTNFSCSIKSVSPIEPRYEALDFLESLEKTEKLLVTYPDSMDLRVDTKDNILSTSFDVNLIYIPAQYEWDFLKNI